MMDALRGRGRRNVYSKGGILMSRRYHGRNSDLWLFDTIAGIAKSVGDYVSDAYREKQGLPSEHRQYMGSLTGGEMDFAMHYQKDLEKAKNMQETTEEELRSKYVTGGDVAMDDVFAAAENAPVNEKDEKEKNDYMDSI